MLLFWDFVGCFHGTLWFSVISKSHYGLSYVFIHILEKKKSLHTQTTPNIHPWLLTCLKHCSQCL
jgi:hypothetical protein